MTELIASLNLLGKGTFIDGEYVIEYDNSLEFDKDLNKVEDRFDATEGSITDEIGNFSFEDDNYIIDGYANYAEDEYTITIAEKEN